MFFQILPQHHRFCGTKLEERTVPVDPRVLTLNPYPIPYCPKCKMYVYGNAESANPEKVGELITRAQEQTNLKSHNSKFNSEYLKKLGKNNS